MDLAFLSGPLPYSDVPCYVQQRMTTVPTKQRQNFSMIPGFDFICMLLMKGHAVHKYPIQFDSMQ